MANTLFSLGKRTDRLVHHQWRRLQCRHPISQTADVLSQKAGAHFLRFLPATAVKMIPVTKRSSEGAKFIKLF
jgi:hypothetical protein